MRINVVEFEKIQFIYAENKAENEYENKQPAQIEWDL